MGWALLIAAIHCLGAASADPAQRVELGTGFFLLSRPQDQPAESQFPLVVCLHGTDDRAEDALAFWTSLDAKLPCVFAAPQGAFAGWRESDLPLLREMLAHLQAHVAFDPGRVLVAGHSAGGAMAFHLLYVENYPASAVAVTANYVPPNVTLDQARARADVPVFYAVGTQDLNHPRMRAGAALLREAGVRITMLRPEIGHVQDRAVGLEAMRWFEGVCRERVQAAIEDARKTSEQGTAVGIVLAGLERIARDAPAHFADQVQAAQLLASKLEQAGRDRLERADGLARQQRFGEARGEYLAVERAFEPASLASRARTARLKLEDQPESALSPRSLKAGEEAEADRLWARIEAALEDANKPKATEYCRELLARYPRSAKADEAATTLRSLQPGGG